MIRILSHSLKCELSCDGYEFHSEREAFQKDRHQSRELQLQGWCVLRFAGLVAALVLMILFDRLTDWFFRIIPF